MRTLAVFGLWLGTLSLVSGQDFRATVLGQVKDPTGSAIPKATVKATKVDTNVSKETITNSEGFYTLVGLDPGVYNVQVTAQGFTTVNRKSIELRVGDKLQLPVTMEVGSVTQEVTVVGEQELIQTTSASRGVNFDPLQVQELPLNGRQSYMLMRFSPGVMFTQRQFGSSGFSGTRAWDVNGSFTMNGGRTGSNQFLLNGAPVSTNGTFNLAPNVEAIQEFKVMVNTYDAQYARSGGGHVSTQLKSGSNQWHGSVFDFWRNRILDANTRQNNAAGQTRGFRNQHQYGGQVGGPIRKDKDFVMFSFEGWRERVPFPSVSTVPPMEIREGNFNFIPAGQTAPIQVFDPMTSVSCSNAGVNCISGGVYQRSPFPGNIIPRSRMNAVGMNILKYYPAPNFTPQSLSQNYVRGDNLGKYRYEQPIGKWDHVISEKHRFNLTYTFQDGSEFRNSNGFDPPAQNGNMTGTVRRDQNLIFAYDWIMTPTRILHWQGSYNRFVENFPDDSSGGTFTYDKLGIKKMPVVPTYLDNLAPRVQVSGYNEIFGNRYVNESSRQQLNFQIYAAETHSRHSLKYGFEWAKLMRHNKDSGRASGLYNFDTVWSRQHQGRRQSGILDGNGVADLMLGYMNSGYVDYNDSYFRREPYMGLYVQDDWKVNNKLTVNFGLRYDLQFGLTESHNRLVAGFNYDQVNKGLTEAVLPAWQKLAAADPNYPKAPAVIKGGLQFAGVNGVSENIYNTDWSNIQPRIGFAYNFMPRTVMRGGFGIFHRTATQNSQTTGFSLQTPYIRSIDGDLTPRAGLTGAYSLEDPFPDGLQVPYGSKLGIDTGIGGGVSFDDRHRPLPRTFQWSYTLERDFGWNTVLELSYVGSMTNKEPRTIQLSEMLQSDYEAAYRNPNFYQATVTNPWYGVLPRNVALGSSSTIQRRDLLRRTPQFNGIQSFINPWGSVYYHGLQARFEKRMLGNRSAGGAFTWILSYTWSKQMENVNRQEYNFEWFQNWLSSVVTADDRTHNFQLVGIWDIPVGKGRHWGNDLPKLADYLLGAWNLNWTMAYQTGVPLGAWTGWKYLCGDPRQVERREDQWFDRRKECYTQNQPFEQQQLMPRFHQLRGHSALQVDLNIAKKINFSERWQLELRAEAFNAFNTPLRGDPPAGNPSDAQFGILPVQQLNFPRNIQLGARLRF